MKDELHPVYCGRETEEQNIEEESRRSPSPSRGCAPPLPPVGFFFFWSLDEYYHFCFGAFKACKK